MRRRKQFAGVAILIVVLMTELTACSSPTGANIPLSSPSGNSLQISVVKQWSSEPSPSSGSVIFSSAIEDSTVIAQVKRLVSAIAVLSPDAKPNCPMFVLPYNSYSLQFFQVGHLIQVVSIDATQCAYVRIRDANKAAGITRCCPDSDFWTQLQQATGAPLPE